MADAIITELKNDHRVIVSLMEGVGASLKENQFSDHKRIESVLVAHIKKEDQSLYPQLLSTAKEKNLLIVLSAIDMAIISMKDISVNVMEFFKRYPTEEDIIRNLSAFQLDLASIGEVLKKRIDFEERLVYRMYEDYCCLGGNKNE
ncbi:MAG: hemerythrin domain-containing protein [Nitrospinae bacterium]|nr:hemerythrin domain-containing protein [Nitrospinota bacterium]